MSRGEAPERQTDSVAFPRTTTAIDVSLMVYQGVGGWAEGIHHTATVTASKTHTQYTKHRHALLNTFVGIPQGWAIGPLLF